MNAITLGNPNFFLKGVAEQTFIDPTTGNIVGYDTVAVDAAITTSVNLQEIAGGMGNALAGVIPDTSRLSGTYTSQAFSLETRKLITGGKLSYGGVASVCETIVATSEKLKVSRVPAKHYAQPDSDEYGWCYVREHGATKYVGTNYGIDLATGEVQDFVAIPETSYDVFYFTVNDSAKVLALPDNFNPSVVSVQTKYGMYAKQNNAVSGGTFQGWLYVIVPMAVLNGDAGLSANQTTNATTSGNWMAMSPDKTVMDCADCASSGNDFCYYVFVPCAGATSAVKALAIVGGGVTVAAGGSVQIPVKYVMVDNTVVQPKYSDLTIASNSTSIATVSNGVITGASAGNTTLTIAGPSGSNVETITVGVHVTAS